MTRIGRYWIFFVIVAVGLALSWAQVGRKTQQVMQDTPVYWLSAEANCRPMQSPCAAMGRDRAIVVGPGTADSLLIRHTGFDAAPLVAVEALWLAADGSERRRIRLSNQSAAWRLSPMMPGDQRLRLTFDDGQSTTVAEFPLEPSQ